MLALKKDILKNFYKLFVVLLFSNCTSFPAQSDDLLVLQKIFDTGKEVAVIPRKTYNIYGTLYLKSNRKISGNGATIIQKKASTPIIDCKDKSDVEISDLNFVGFKYDYQPSSSSLAVGIYCWGTKNLVIRKNSFRDFSNTPIAGLRNTFNITIDKNSFIGTGIFDKKYYQKDHTGITLGGENIIIRNNDITNSSQGIMIAERSKNIEITDNRIHNLPLEHGIYVDYGCSDIVIKNNTIENVGGSGIKVQNRNFPDAKSVNISIIENKINGTKNGDGILVYNAEGDLLFANNVLIENNILNNIGQNGINVRITKNSKILNNNINNINRSGIYLKENFNLLIDHNDMENMGESGIFDEGSGESILITNNIINNPGSNGTDKNGLSSGIFIEAGANREIGFNKIIGFKNKMRYALYIANGDQKTISINNNTFSGARDYGIRLNEKKNPLKLFKSNTMTATAGKNEVMNMPVLK